MANTYTTAQLDGIIATLEAGLALGYVEVSHDGRRLVYRSVTDIRTAIAYFKGLYSSASDAPTPETPRTRTYFVYGDKGFGIR